MISKFYAVSLHAASVVICIGLSLSMPKSTFAQERAVNKANVVVEKFKGLCYGPHRDNEDPDFSIQPTITELSDDLALVKNLTPKIRTYGITDGLEQIPILCEQLEVDCYPGAWISKYGCENERQIDSLIAIANRNLKHVKGLIVGNEVLLRNDVSEQKLLEYITRVRNSTKNLPITTAETWKDWLDHPRLAQAVDILLVHIYPYWDGKAAGDGTNYVLEKWNELKTKYPNKTMIIGETGWPSKGQTQGNAIPSEENQKKYLTDFIAMANSNNIDYFYFEIFDEKWKSKFEGETGGNWGLYYSNGSLKPHLKACIPEQAWNGIIRPPRKVDPKIARLPLLYVYSDACDPKNSFYSSGWMGELANLPKNDSTNTRPTQILDEASANNPFSGKTCIRISYKPSIGQWGGIYWQFPVNNWGTYPGYNLSKSVGRSDTVKLKFRVRGEKGGEKAEFKTGGIYDSKLNYKDSYGPISTGVITLRKEWEERSIVLIGQSVSMVIGGFVWVSEYRYNPQGATIYLDDIVFTVSEPSLLPNFTTTPIDSLTVQFNDASSPSGQIAARSWNFGDGLTSTEKDPLHTYLNKGIYKVSLTVVGQSDIKTKYVDALRVRVDERSNQEASKVFALYPNYPNPFNPSTTIEYSLPKAARVELKVYNIFGHEVAALVNGKQEAGKYRVQFDSQGLPSGVYFFRLRAGERMEVRKMVIIR